MHSAASEWSLLFCSRADTLRSFRATRSGSALKNSAVLQKDEHVLTSALFFCSFLPSFIKVKEGEGGRGFTEAAPAEEVTVPPLSRQPDKCLQPQSAGLSYSWLHLLGVKLRQLRICSRQAGERRRSRSRRRRMDGRTAAEITESERKPEGGTRWRYEEEGTGGREEKASALGPLETALFL